MRAGSPRRRVPAIRNKELPAMQGGPKPLAAPARADERRPGALGCRGLVSCSDASSTLAFAGSRSTAPPIINILITLKSRRIRHLANLSVDVGSATDAEAV